MAVDRASVVRKAEAFIQQGKLDLAIAEYRALVDEQPGDLSAANTLGDLYARSGEIDKAIEQFTRLAESERSQGFVSKAVALYKKALKADPGCELALSQLAEIAVGQQLLADATLYLNRLLQGRRDRSDQAGVAETLVRLAGLPVAKADTKLAAARAAEAHVPAEESGRLFADAARALEREARLGDAVEAWLEAAHRSSDSGVRQDAARACAAAGAPDRAQAFLTVEVAGDDPALLWVVAERAAQADDEAAARAALERYRALVPSDAERVAALLAKWEVEPPPAPEPVPAPVEATEVVLESADVMVVQAVGVPAVGLVSSDRWPDEAPVEEVDLADAFGDSAGPGPAVEADLAPADAAAEAADQRPEGAVHTPPVMEAAPAEPSAESPAEEPVVDVAPPPVHFTVEVTGWTELDDSEDDAPLVDDAAVVAQLEAAADTPALQFQAAAQLGRLFIQRGQRDRGIEWLQRACRAQAPVRDHGLAALYDLADALEKNGQHDRALAVWSDLEFEAGAYRDVPERVAALTRRLGSAG